MTTPSTPTGAKLTDDEWNTFVLILHEWGFEYHLQADTEKVEELQRKFPRKI